jgi:hypothetical protein
MTDPRDVAACQACGACCVYSHQWPRFTLETDGEIARIPVALVAADETGMRCDGNRCSALAGDVGQSVSCRVYIVRPIVCRDCLPGDDACQMARAKAGMTPWPAAP